jgi:uncharacterized protein YprB with RNaseH-like and TPR domain
MIYLFIDTETTGLGKSDVVLQLAYIATNADGIEVLEKDATNLTMKSIQRPRR